MKRNLISLVLLLTTALPCLAGDWSTFAYDQRRSGWARDEVILNRDNVANLTLKWKKTVENETKSLTALTAPIVITDVRTADGEIVWKKKFTTQIQAKSEGGWLCPKGLNATPTVDVKKNTIYVIAVDGKFYGLDLGTGREKFRAQQFVPAFAKTWSLNRIGDTLYTPLSQYCGETPSGVASIDVSDPTAIVIRHWRSTPRYASGVWGRAGVAIGKDGSIYAGTGDGAFNAAQGLYGNTMFRLNPETLKLEDYFTPPNWDYVYKRDFDITVSATVFEYGDRELMVVGGKEGVVYLIDTANMGGATHHKNLYTTPLLSNEEEWFEAKGLWGAFSHYIDDQGRNWIYVPSWGAVAKQAPSFPMTNGPNPNGSVMAFTVADHPDSGKPYLKPAWVSGDFAVPEPVVVANDVVFALSNGENARQSVNAGIMPFGTFNVDELLADSTRADNKKTAELRALDALTGKTLYDSGPDVFNSWAHFTGIAVAEGQVYAVDFSSTVYCFALKKEE